MAGRHQARAGRHVVRYILAYGIALSAIILAARGAVSATTPPLSGALATALRTNITVAILLIGVPALIVHVVLISASNRRRAREIDRVRHAIDRFAAGGSAPRLQSADMADLADVVRSFNAMTSSVDAQLSTLRSEQVQRQAILESMSAGVVALDREQRLLDVNQAARRMLGLHDVAQGRLVQEVIRLPDILRFLSDTFAGTAPKTMEFNPVRDEPVILQGMTERLTDAEGRFRGLLLILNDVTQLRRLESLRSDFAANVSHELRTPITNIRGYVETLEEIGFDDKERATRFLSIIRKNSGRLAAIVEDIMALTKLEQRPAGTSLERRVIPLSRVIASAISQFQSAAAAKQIAIAMDIPSEVRAEVHAQLLEQAVANLLANAINYSPSETTVTIGLLKDDSFIRISVRDEGPGIPSEHLPRLFERFYRVDKARSRVLGGTGLGLALTKHIALVHGGRPEVESVVGSGSTFRILLPAGLVASERSAPTARPHVNEK
jgi:two-component system phosphate regulon sensor histidine kinase PhoR